MLEERASFSPDSLTGLEANLRFAGPGNDGDADLRPADRLAELDLPAPERRWRERRAETLRDPANALYSTAIEFKEHSYARWYDPDRRRL